MSCLFSLCSYVIVHEKEEEKKKEEEKENFCDVNEGEMGNRMREAKKNRKQRERKMNIKSMNSTQPIRFAIF